MDELNEIRRRLGLQPDCTIDGILIAIDGLMKIKSESAGVPATGSSIATATHAAQQEIAAARPGAELSIGAMLFLTDRTAFDRAAAAQHTARGHPALTVAAAASRPQSGTRTGFGDCSPQEEDVFSALGLSRKQVVAAQEQAIKDAPYRHSKFG